MTQFHILTAAARLADLVARAAAGEEVVISDDSGSVARNTDWSPCGSAASYATSSKPTTWGVVFAAETGFQLDRDPDLVRAPDVSFVRKQRLPGGRVSRGFFQGGPDLAVEVVSPTESRRDVAEKVNLWLARGAAAVWVADPPRMTVTVHRVGQPPQRLTIADQVRDEPLLPGITMAVAKVFRLP